jgi:acetyl esterase/lipase
VSHSFLNKLQFLLFMTVPFVVCVLASLTLASNYSPINIRAKKVVEIWPDGVPGDWKQSAKEVRVRTGGVTRIANVSKPTLAFYPTAKANAPAIIVCPGGGYRKLAYDKEGEEIAQWLSTIGVNAFLLKYRLPVKGDVRHEPALEDAQRAVSLVRSLALEMKMDTKRIGIMGFSAGGHLSAATSTIAPRTYIGRDAIDKFSNKVDFTVLIYPAYLQSNGKLSSLFKLAKNTPPCFIAHSDDDRNYIAGSVIFHEALLKAGAESTFKHYKTGGHGNGMRKVNKEMDQWPTALATWLKKL